MKLAIPIAAITLLLSSIGAHADGTWCAQYGGTHGGTNCGFYSFQQCEAARSGNGAFATKIPSRNRSSVIGAKVCGRRAD
jgi:hypothetical protein